MREITVRSSSEYPVEILLDSALKREERKIRRGIEMTKARISEFEVRFATPSEEFLRLYMNDEWEETDDTTDWIGEIRMLERLDTKLAALQGIAIEN